MSDGDAGKADAVVMPAWTRAARPGAIGRAVLLLLLAGAASACRSSSAPATHAAFVAALPAPPRPASGTDASAQDSALEAFAATHRREAEAFGHVQRLYLIRPQTAPIHFVDLQKRRPNAPVGPLRARMFAFGFGYGCDDDRLVRPDGTICPGAVYPGSTLSDAQTAQAAEIWRTAAVSWARRARPQCFEPHHAIVLFDEHEAPVAELTICFECNTFRTTPGPLDDAAATDAEAAFFAETCRERGVGACPPAGKSRMPDLPPPPEAALPDAEHRASQWKGRLDRPEGVPPDRRLRDMTLLERGLLCGWIDGAMRLGPSAHYGCEDGGLVWVDDTDGCKRWPPSACEATVDDVVACTRSRVRSPCGAETSACASVHACRWGLRETTEAPRPASSR